MKAKCMITNFKVWWRSDESAPLREILSLIFYSFLMGVVSAMVFFGSLIESLRY